MNLVIMQPFYLFLRKHFHQVYRADTYVFYDDVQFVKGGHHNRNRIKGPDGPMWLTVPVKKKNRFPQYIKDVEIDDSQNWRRKHFQGIVQGYSKAPYFNDYISFFEECYARPWDKLADLNIYLIENISRMLGIKDTVFLRSSELKIGTPVDPETGKANPTQRLIDICEMLGADRYIIGTRAKDYMEDWRWEKTKVVLEYFEPDYPVYPQLWGEFFPYCAIIDLLFNCGPQSGQYIWGNDENT